MQEINQNKNIIILPQAICIFKICFYLIFVIFSLINKDNIIIFIFFLLIILYHLFIYYNIRKGIKNKNYLKYKKSINLSKCYSIVISIIKIIFLIYYILQESFHDNHHSHKSNLIASYFFLFLYCFLLFYLFYLIVY